MGKLIIIKSDKFDQMQKHERLANRKEMKEKLMDGIKAVLRDEWYAYKDATRAVFDDIAYKASDRGYSFNGYETIVNKFKVSIATAKRVVRRLKDAGLIIVCYRKNPRGNGAKTPVIFFKDHPHFAHWCSFLGLKDTVSDTLGDTVENSDKLTDTGDQTESSASTYDLPLNTNNINQYSSNFIKYVPKSLQNLKTTFGNSLTDVWLRFNLAIKKLGLKLDKLTKETIGRNVLSAVVNEYIKQGKAASTEEKCKLVYTVAYNELQAIYGGLGADDGKGKGRSNKRSQRRVIRRELVPTWMNQESKEDVRISEQFSSAEEEEDALKKLIANFSV